MDAVKDPAATGFTVKVTVRDVADAVVTVPKAPLLNVTALRDATGSKPKPAIVTVVALAARFAMPEVITGVTVATWMALPLARLLVVTIAVRLPAVVGLVVNVTVSDVAVAEVTVPTAPLLNTTEFCDAVGLNPSPVMVTVPAFAARFVVVAVTEGVIVATAMLLPFEMPFEITDADNAPTLVGRVDSDTVSVVAVAAVTDPTAPLLNVTVLLAAVVSNPYPKIDSVVALADTRLPVFVSTTGVTVAIWTAEPLVWLFVVTIAVSVPAFAGFVVSVIVSDVALADAIVPTALLLSVTALFASVGSKPKPLIVIDEAFARRLAVLFVTTGVIVAICTAEPLPFVFDVTIAVRLPAVAGRVENVTVSDVFVAAVTVPTALLLNTTVLLAGSRSNPKPLMVTVLESAASPEVTAVTTGVTVATWTAVPLVCPPVVTMAVRLPAAFGFVEKLTVKVVAVAAVTVPTAPLLN